MPNIRHRVGIAAQPQRVFENLTSIDGIRGWWDSHAQGDAAAGPTFTFSGDSMDVVQADPTLIPWRYSGPAKDWVGTEVRFELVRRDSQTFVLFTHADWREPTEFMHHCSTKWAVFLLSLKDLVEQGKGRAKPRDTQISLGD
jgi:uncharacterized protein YndB with AHSA1/START domain